MSYDLYFFKQLPGKTLAETFASLTPDEPNYTDPLEALNTREVADTLLALGLGLQEAESEATDETIEINTAEPETIPIQILIDENMVGISLPYWDVTTDSLNELKRQWSIIAPALENLGLSGYDPQANTRVTEASIDEMTISVAQGAKDLADAIAEAHKPWWKIW